MEVIASVSAPDLEIDSEECLAPQDGEPCIIVIMGATGDLTARKLIPALFNLYINGGLPESFQIVGCGRTKLQSLEFKKKMETAMDAVGISDRAGWQDFAAALHYQTIDYDNPESYSNLAAFIGDLDRRSNTRGNRIFYIALPPILYKTVAQMIGRAGLSAEMTDGNGWSRIVVEKPFGTNLETAVDLDRSLHQYFKERQIFRIDHYLAKETVQNILMFRFANALFEPIWNRRYIDHVIVTATETLGVEHRAGYYERSGVLRDMFQNHMMQLLALTAMEPPSRFEDELVRDEKTKVFRALRPFPVKHLQDYLVLGQYSAGIIEGRPVPAYRQEPDVDPNSITPTFAMMKVFLDNWRWQGVPFYMTSGKRLTTKLTEIAIQFKTVPYSMFRHVIGEAILANRLTLGIYPDEKITLSFQTKNPGAQVCLRTVTMNFHYDQNYTGPTLDAYEKVLLDCMLGDQMLFWRQDSVERCWSFLNPILHECETCGNREQLLHFYESGSMGPEAAQNLIKKNAVPE